MRYLRRFFLSLLLTGVSGGGAYASEPPVSDPGKPGIHAAGEPAGSAGSSADPAMVAVDEPRESDIPAGEEGTEALASANPVWKSINDSRREQVSGSAISGTPDISEAPARAPENSDNSEGPVSPLSVTGAEDGELKGEDREQSGQESRMENSGESGDTGISAGPAPESANPVPEQEAEPASASADTAPPGTGDEAAPGENAEPGPSNAELSPTPDPGTPGTPESGAENGTRPAQEVSSAAVSKEAPSLEADISGDHSGTASPDDGGAGDSVTLPSDSGPETPAYGDSSDSSRPEGGMGSGTPRYYSREYFENLFLPYFYHTYEVPQSLDNFFSLVDIHVAEDGTGLVMGINAVDNIGPLDLDGQAQDSGHMRTFCLLALRLGVLHRTENIYLEFFHDTRNFFNKKISYSFCTGKSPLTVGKKILDSEEVRLDDEFVYAYEKENGKLLSREYLRTAFAPYAFERMHEKFLPEEQEPRMSVTDDGNLAVNFLISQSSRSVVRSSGFVEGRIRRTCGNETYRNWILPRIGEIHYYYRLSDGTPVKDIAVSSSVCSAAEVTALQ